MNVTEQSNDSTLGFYSYEKNGKTYALQVLPLEYAREYMAEPYQFVLPRDGDYQQVALNFSVVKGENGKSFDMSAMLEKWIPRFVRYGNEPCTLQKLIEDRWDIVDIGKMLEKVLAVSG